MIHNVAVLCLVAIGMLGTASYCATLDVVFGRTKTAVVTAAVVAIIEFACLVAIGFIST